MDEIVFDALNFVEEPKGADSCGFLKEQAGVAVMKVCGDCGAKNKNTVFYCIQCKEKLGEPISEEEKEAIEKQTERMLEKLSKKPTDQIVEKLYKKPNPTVFIIESEKKCGVQTPGESPHRCGGPPPFTKGGKENTPSSLPWKGYTCLISRKTHGKME